ncbi:MAG: CHAD domain-containing protein [Planctomycetota bacterium]|nr:CHAD domain-containing protein [Planctomycetota bacterium]
MRVATRRARFALRMMRPFFGDDCERLRKELKWLADVLGDVRDCDVMTENLHEPLGRTENLLSGQDRFLAYLENQRIPARKRLKEALVSSRYEKLLNDLFELYRSPSPQLPPEKRPTRNYASKLIRKAGRKVRKSLGGLADPPSSEQLHEVRIAVKRLRYTCEYFKVLYRGKLRDTIKDCKLVQDCLGEHQDAAVAIGALKDIAQALSSERENTQAVMVTGALLEMQRRRVLERRELALPLLEDFAKRVAALAKLL